jgi:DNA replication protein DnaC
MSAKALTKLSKVQVLIIDDLFLTPLTDLERKDLLEIVEDRAGTTPTIITSITSQCPIKEWHRHVGDLTVADAVCDRLLHTAYKIELKGESMRKVTPEARRASSSVS